MSSRFPRDDRDSRDSRYQPRDRERSPPRFADRDRRPSGAFTNSYSPRDYSGPPGRPLHSTTRFDNRPAPSPRGRGFAPRPEFRDFRDGRTSPSDRSVDRRRDAEYDRWERRRSRSPPTRDARDQPPKEIDVDRARRHSRDGPPSAGSNLSDPPRGSASSYRGGYRGSDWGFRGRGRGYAGEERDTFRARSRSREGRRDRERSIDSREADRREELANRRDDDRRNPRDRDDYFGRRDGLARADTRQSDQRYGVPSGPSTPQTEQPPATPAALTKRPSAGELRKDSKPSSRPAPADSGLRDTRHDRADHPLNRTEPSVEQPNRTSKSDLIASRAENTRERYASRASSPPPAAPQVPSFGFQPWSFNSAPSRNMVWRNPATQKPTVPSASPATAETSAPTKAPPTAPRAELASNPPTAPKADLLRQKLSVESLGTAADTTKAGGDLHQQPPPQPPIASKRMTAEAVDSVVPVAAKLSETHLGPPVKHLAPPLTAPAAPRAMTSQQAFGRSPPPPAGMTRDIPASNASPIPSGPRVPATSPKALPINIPTGPKADRAIVQQPKRAPPIAPRAELARQNSFAMSNWRQPSQWSQPSSSILPQKRDAAGDGKDRKPIEQPRTSPAMAATEPFRKVARMEEQASATDGATVLEHLEEISMAKTEQKQVEQSEKKSQDVHMADPPSLPEGETKREAAEVTSGPATKLSSDEDDEDFQEEDFEEHEHKFLREKTRLSGMIQDLSSRRYRSTTPLEQISHLWNIKRILPDINFRSREVQEGPEQATGTKNDASIPSPEGEGGVHSGEVHDYRAASPTHSSSPESDEGVFPIAPPSPLSNAEAYYGKRYQELAVLLTDRLCERHNLAMQEELDLETQYSKLYRGWKSETRELDLIRKEESVSVRDSPRPEAAQTPIEIPMAPLLTPGDGRRHRISTEWDLQQVIEMSKREYQQQQQKEAGATHEPEIDHDKEATIPEMLYPEEAKRRLYKDTNQARPAKEALRFFEFAPPEDTFTEEEDRLLRDLYNANSKAWGKIASLMREKMGTNRTYKECINHYYATKWDKPYKKLPGKGRKGPTRSKKTLRRPVQTFTNGDETETMENGAEGTPQVSETGRPRRAAAPKHFGDKDAEAAQALAVPKTGAKGESAEPGPEKPRRKPKGEKAPKAKKGTQPIAARQAAPSPSKLDGKLDERLFMEQAEDWRLATEHRSTGPEGDKIPLAPQPPNEPIAAYHAQPDALSLPVAGERPRAYSNQQRAGASSYWSVAEEQTFKDCLAYFGRDYQAIADHMGTKTQVMIKNKYDKLVQSNKHPELIIATDLADARRARGEDIGPPPEHSIPSSRRPRTVAQPAVPRTLASRDAVEVDNSPLMRPAASLHGSPPQVPQHPKPPAVTLAQRSPALPSETPPVSYPATQHPTAQAVPIGFQPRPPAAGPKLGLFSEPRSNPSRLGPFEEPAQETLKRGFQPLQNIDRIKSEHEPGSHRRISSSVQESGYPSVTVTPKRDDSFQRQPNPFQDALQQQPPTHVRQSSRGHLPEIFGPTRHQEPTSTPQAAPILHHAQAGPSGVPLQAPPTQDPTQPLSRFHGQPPPNQPLQHVMQPMPLQREPPKEQPKRMNIMSLMNPAPEESKPRRQEPPPAAPAPRPQSSQPPHISSRQYGGSPLSQGLQHPTALSMPGNDRVDAQNTPVSHRDSWPGRQSFAQPAQRPPQGGSPPLQHSQSGPVPTYRNSLGERDFRNVMSSTPPPTFGHSRASSLSQQPHHGVDQYSAQPAGASTADAGPRAGALQPNPFASVQPFATQAPRRSSPPPPPQHQYNSGSTPGESRYNPLVLDRPVQHEAFARYRDDDLAEVRERVIQRERDRQQREAAEQREKERLARSQHHHVQQLQQPSQSVEGVKPPRFGQSTPPSALEQRSSGYAQPPPYPPQPPTSRTPIALSGYPAATSGTAEKKPVSYPPPPVIQKYLNEQKPPALQPPPPPTRYYTEKTGRSTLFPPTPPPPTPSGYHAEKKAPNYPSSSYALTPGTDKKVPLPPTPTPPAYPTERNMPLGRPIPPPPPPPTTEELRMRQQLQDRMDRIEKQTPLPPHPPPPNPPSFGTESDARMRHQQHHQERMRITMQHQHAPQQKQQQQQPPQPPPPPRGYDPRRREEEEYDEWARRRGM